MMLSRFSWNRWTRLQKALFISFVFHGALLTLRVAAPERFDRLFNDVPLDVILVNTRVKAEAPDKAQALAQTQLAGGGELKSGRVQIIFFYERSAQPVRISETDLLLLDVREILFAIENL